MVIHEREGCSWYHLKRCWCTISLRSCRWIPVFWTIFHPVSPPSIFREGGWESGCAGVPEELVWNRLFWLLPVRFQAWIWDRNSIISCPFGWSLVVRVWWKRWTIIWWRRCIHRDYPFNTIKHGMRGMVLCRFISFLQGESQLVMIGSERSSPCPLFCEVPTGLGALCFLTSTWTCWVRSSVTLGWDIISMQMISSCISPSLLN